MSEVTAAVGSMRLARVHGAGDMRVDEVPIPELGPKDVLVRVGVTGVCGSDLGYVAAGGLGRRTFRAIADWP